MDTSNIKKYAPKARTAFQQAVTAKANSLGINESNIENATIKGDFLMVADSAFPSSIKSSRDLLVREIERQGFEYVIEQVASTWFNRFCAIRFMELKGYLEHGYRVLSHPTEAHSLEILSYAADVADDFSLEREKLLELSLTGNKEEEIYRQLILGQCHVLHQAMPFLFEKIDGIDELLLPDGLTRTDSIIRDLVNDIPEDDWPNVEIIGWLYQFYISEKKDEVIGKVVKSEDIPAATQLFTPNWIVQYLVQNSVGRQWLQTYPESTIKAEMPYYIEPAQQSDEVNKQLAEITPSSLDPETIKVLDPACGSGHILVEAYKTLTAIYNERGYKPRDIPKLILEKNLFGLDIDDRAAQLAGFALMMMARADDRRIFTRGVQLNVLSLQETSNFDIDSLWQQLDLNSQSTTGVNDDMFAVAEQNSYYSDPKYQLLVKCKEWFLQAKTLGSLIDVSNHVHGGLTELSLELSKLIESGRSLQKKAAEYLLPIVNQALVLSKLYDAVVANPPYMGTKGMNGVIKDFAIEYFPDSKADLFAIFMQRSFRFLKDLGYNAQVNMQSWMFLSSYHELRQYLLKGKSIHSLMQIGYNSFPELNSKVVQCAAFSIQNIKTSNFKGVYTNLNSAGQSADKKSIFKNNKGELNFNVNQESFESLPGCPIAYWLSNDFRNLFSRKLLKDNFDLKAGMSTGDNLKFQRLWFEISIKKIKFDSKDPQDAINSKVKWFPCNSGGGYRKWYGNNLTVVNWQNDGEEIRNFRGANGKLKSAPRNTKSYFKSGVTWTKLAIKFAARKMDNGFTFDDTGRSGFAHDERYNSFILALMVSKLSKEALLALTPTLSFTSNELANIPLIIEAEEQVTPLANQLIEMHRKDWNNFEFSWAFKKHALIDKDKRTGLESLVSSYIQNCKQDVQIAFEKENKINELIIDAANLNDEIKKEINIEDLTLFINPDYKFGRGNVNSQSLFESEVITELISYSVGCMMGRYSLDREGLVYAHSGNKGFDDLVADKAYKSFPADDDGIVPLTDMEWFSDDATYRFRDFVKTVWGKEQLQENLDFVAESLCLHAIKPKRGESSLVTIRRYMSNQFFKDHLKTYKKRPIYWLFSSGKLKAFECLVYLHRYNDGTLSRMRTQYVTPLIGKYQARIGQLEQKLDGASTSDKARLSKDIALLEKKQVELRSFDDNLKHYADMRISIDLDDGVKVNYGKFGNLLAEVKAIHGQAVK